MIILTIFILGLLMILDPCTLITSVAAVGYIDREVENKRRILIAGALFGAGKIATYMLLSVPFLMGAETEWVHSVLAKYGEPAMGVFLVLCGIVQLFSGHHHHEHDHGMSRWLKTVDESSYPFWAFMLGIFFAIAFCPHRLIYFLMMIDLTIQTAASSELSMIGMPLIFGLGTALPILLIAWAIPYGIVSTEGLTQKLKQYEHWIRIVCAVAFIMVGVYVSAEAILG